MLTLNNDLGRVCEGGRNAAPDLNHFAICPKQSPLNCGPHSILPLPVLGANCDYFARLLTWPAKITIHLVAANNKARPDLCCSKLVDWQISKYLTFGNWHTSFEWVFVTTFEVFHQTLITNPHVNIIVMGFQLHIANIPITAAVTWCASHRIFTCENISLVTHLLALAANNSTSKFDLCLRWKPR